MKAEVQSATNDTNGCEYLKGLFLMSLTIDKKVSLFISVMILVFGAVSGIYIMRSQTEHLRHDLDMRASVLLSNLAFNLEYPAMVRDSEAISRLVGG